MKRLGGFVLICLACEAPQPEIHWNGAGEDETGGISGTATGGQGTGGAQTGGLGAGGADSLGGAPAGGAAAIGGSGPPSGGSSAGGPPQGGSVQGGASTGGYPSGGSVVTGGVGPIGGAQATGGASGTGPTGGSGGRLLWSHDFAYDGTLVAGTTARHQLRFYLNYPSDMASPCLITNQDDVPHGTTGTTTFDLGTLLSTCLGSVPTTSLSRHTFNLTAQGSALVTGGGNFELPEESRHWKARAVVRRITVNTWNPGAVTVRETWEIRE